MASNPWQKTAQTPQQLNDLMQAFGYSQEPPHPTADSVERLNEYLNSLGYSPEQQQAEAPAPQPSPSPGARFNGHWIRTPKGLKFEIDHTWQENPHE